MAPEAVSWFKKGEGLIGTSQAYSEQQAHFFEKALEIEPEFVAALFNLALIYLRQEKLTGALAVLDRLIRIEPDNGPAYSLRVEVYMRRNDLSSAAADTDRLKRLAPDMFLTWRDSGTLNYRLGRMAAAIADLEVNRWVLMGVINLFLLVAGFFLPPVAVIVMTAPILLPIILAADFDPYWAGNASGVGGSNDNIRSQAPLK